MNISGLLSSLSAEATSNNGVASNAATQQDMSGLFAALLANITNANQQGTTQLAEITAAGIDPALLTSASASTSAETSSALFALLAANDDINPDLINAVEGAPSEGSDETASSDENLTQLAALLGLSLPPTDAAPVTPPTPVIPAEQQDALQTTSNETIKTEPATATATTMTTNTVAPVAAATQQPAATKPAAPAMQPAETEPQERRPNRTVQAPAPQTNNVANEVLPSSAQTLVANTTVAAATTPPETKAPIAATSKRPSTPTLPTAAATTTAEQAAEGSGTETADTSQVGPHPTEPMPKAPVPAKTTSTASKPGTATTEASNVEPVSHAETISSSENTADVAQGSASSITAATDSSVSAPALPVSKAAATTASTTSTTQTAPASDEPATTATNSDTDSDSDLDGTGQKTADADKATTEKPATERAELAPRSDHRAAADRLVNTLTGNNGDPSLRPAGIPHHGQSLSAPGQTVASNTMPSHLATQLAQNAPVDQIAVQIAMQARAGNQRFDIRLDPPELGRVDIRLEIKADGQTLTHLAVEKPETLDMLQRDARHLERALQNSGLDSRDGSLSFSLRQDGRQQQQQQANFLQPEFRNPANTSSENEQEQMQAAEIRTVNVSAGLDISI